MNWVIKLLYPIGAVMPLKGKKSNTSETFAGSRPLKFLQYCFFFTTTHETFTAIG